MSATLPERTIMPPRGDSARGRQEAQQLRQLLGILQGDSDHPRARLVGPDGSELDLPQPVYEVLREVVESLSHGLGITVVPQNTTLTTQEAADLLGISRPTFVRLLDQKVIPYTRPGRHRRVLLADVLAYQSRMRAERRGILTQMAHEGQATGAYEAADVPTLRTR